MRQPAHDLGLYTIHVKFRNVSRRGPLRRGDDRSFVKQVAQIAFGYFNDHCVARRGGEKVKAVGHDARNVSFGKVARHKRVKRHAEGITEQKQTAFSVALRLDDKIVCRSEVPLIAEPAYVIEIRLCVGAAPCGHKHSGKIAVVILTECISDGHIVCVPA